MTKFNLEMLDDLGNFLISQARYRHTTTELLVEQILREWKEGVERGDIPSPPGLDVNALARELDHSHPEEMP